jgi:4-amino-4-deoxy-L-arabinose transferase-like glycosyltransferase
MLISQDARWVSLFQILLTFVICFLLYQIGLELGSKRAGQAASIIYMLNPNAAFWSAILLTETLTSFWLVLALWTLVRFWNTRQSRWLMGSGLSLGLGALTRPIVYPLIITWLMMLAALWILSRSKLVITTETLKNLVVFALSGLLLGMLWQVRNYSVHGQFTLSPIGRSTFQNFMVAKAIAEMRGITRDQAVAEIAVAPDPFGYSLNFIKEHPAAFLKTQVRGLLRALLGAEYGTWADVLAGQKIQTTGILSNLDFSSVLNQLQVGNRWLWAGIYALVFDIIMYGLGLSALWRIVWRYRKDLAFNLTLITMVTLAYILISPGPAGESRFRVPVDPYLAMLAGLAFFAPAQKAKPDPQE